MKRSISLVSLFTMAFSAPAIASPESNATAVTKAWADCLMQNTQKYEVLTSETADTVVTAAFGECSNHESGVRLAILPMHMRAYVGIAHSTSEMVSMAERDTDITFTSLRRGYWGKMVAMVFEDRAASAIAPTTGK